jgi:DNA polymerase-3 subunit beta
MEFSTTASGLNGALTRARKAMVDAPPLVAYTGVLIRAEGGRVLVTGGDGETTVTVTVPADVASDGSALVVPGPLGGYLAKLGDVDVTVAVEDTSDVVVSRSGKSPYRFRQLASTFPPPPTGGRDMREVDLPDLARVVATVRHASSGVTLLRSSDAGVTFATTDGYRIARAKAGGRGFGDASCVLTASGLDNLAANAPTHLALDAKGRMLRAKGADSFTVIRLVDEPFPDVDAIVDGFVADEVRFDPGDVTAALRRLAAVAERTPLRVHVAGGTLTLTAENANVGAGSEQVDVRGGQAEFTCHVDAGYLLDAISAHSGEVTLGWNGPVNPLHVRSDHTQTVVMPVSV